MATMSAWLGATSFDVQTGVGMVNNLYDCGESFGFLLGWKQDHLLRVVCCLEREQTRRKQKQRQLMLSGFTDALGQQHLPQDLCYVRWMTQTRSKMPMWQFASSGPSQMHGGCSPVWHTLCANFTHKRFTPKWVYMNLAAMLIAYFASSGMRVGLNLDIRLWMGWYGLYV